MDFLSEVSNDQNWRWCGPTGELYITNPTGLNKTVSFETTFITGYPDNSQLKIYSTHFADEIEINHSGTFYHKTLVLPPGVSTIFFSSNAKKVIASGDTRELIFYLKNFKISYDNFVAQ